MKKASSNLFDLVYGVLIPVESTIFGKMCFIFYTPEDDPKSKIIYYPSTKEVKTLRSLEIEFSEFIPLYREEFIKQFSEWVKSRYFDQIIFKGIEYIDFLEELDV